MFVHLGAVRSIRSFWTDPGQRLTEDCSGCCCAADELFTLFRRGVTGKSEAARETCQVKYASFAFCTFHSLWHTEHTNTTQKCDWFDAASKGQNLDGVLILKLCQGEIKHSLWHDLSSVYHLDSWWQCSAVAHNVTRTMWCLNTEGKCQGATHQVARTAETK